MTQEQFDELLDDATHAVAELLKQASVGLSFVDYSAINDALNPVLRDIIDIEEK